MSKDAGAVRVGANGTIRVAPVGTAIPDHIDDPFDPAWVDIGYADEDGVAVTDGKTIEAIKAWQSFYPLRRIITERDMMFVFKLLQFAGPQVEFAFGGGSVEARDSGYRYTPPSPSELDERALAVDWADGDFAYRWVLLRGTVTENVETTLARTDAAKLPITFSLLGEDGTDPWFLDTNDESFAELVGSGS